jgi:hypothetical protein
MVGTIGLRADPGATGSELFNANRDLRSDYTASTALIAKHDIPWSVVGIGSSQIGSPSYAVRGTVGQTAMGTVANTSYNHMVGYWCDLGSTVTSSRETGGEAQRVFALFQNHPNPFNPITTIRFSLPRAYRVTLRIYDVSGRLISTIVDKEIPGGLHDAVWDATGVASGVYFYRLEAPSFVQTRKLVLLK